jgi:hypothetical protein
VKLLFSALRVLELEDVEFTREWDPVTMYSGTEDQPPEARTLRIALRD